MGWSNPGHLSPPPTTDQRRVWSIAASRAASRSVTSTRLVLDLLSSSSSSHPIDYWNRRRWRLTTTSSNITSFLQPQYHDAVLIRVACLLPDDAHALLTYRHRKTHDNESAFVTLIFALFLLTTPIDWVIRFFTAGSFELFHSTLSFLVHFHKSF